MAGVPSAANSTTPSCVPLVGSTAGVPDATGLITVVVRDLANNPLSGASVVVDISGCTELALCDDQLDANALVVCASQTTRKFTDGLGSVQFVVLGGGQGPAATLLGGGKIFANGTLIGSPTVNSYDENGIGGLGAADLSTFLADFASGNPTAVPTSTAAPRSARGPVKVARGVLGWRLGGVPARRSARNQSLM
jgi:hypothetical protein